MKEPMLIVVLLISITALFGVDILQEVDSPTAHILDRGEYQIFGKIYRDDGIISGASVGLLPNFMFGFSFGGENMVGNQEMKWHKTVEFQARYQLFDQSERYPSLALGFDSQGHGAYHSNYERYDIKSKGFYLVVSRDDMWKDKLAMHFGVNRSLEDKDQDKDIDAFVAADFKFNDALNFVAEYDGAFNDNELSNRTIGYLNCGAVIKLTNDVQLKILLHDFMDRSPNLDHSPHKIGIDRSVLLQYGTHF